MKKTEQLLQELFLRFGDVANQRPVKIAVKFIIKHRTSIATVLYFAAGFLYSLSEPEKQAKVSGVRTLKNRRRELR